MSPQTLYISYLDETKVLDKYTIVSFTAKKSDYLGIIEPAWERFRSKYGIPVGQTLHFTDIKQLLNPNTRSHKPQWTSVFGIGAHIDFPKLHDFFSELIDLLNRLPFVIQSTSMELDPTHNIRQRDVALSPKTFFPAYTTFREHLNLMSVYLTKLDTSRYDGSNLGLTKLRYDGDIGLGERDDLKEAYHHAISLGTRHFRSELVRKLFDEIRFIGKDEVGHPVANGATHAGSEIVDFMASNVARHIWGGELAKTKIIVPGHAPGFPTIDPIPTVSTKLSSHQKIKDIPF